MSEEVDFGLDLHGNLGKVSQRFAADVKALRAELDRLSSSHSKSERELASQSYSRQQLLNLRNHSNALTRLNRSYRDSAPASRLAVRGLRAIGVQGQTIRRFAVDAAKGEIALRRLYRLNGGGMRGAASVGAAVGRRALPGAASGAWSATKGAAGFVGSGALLVGGAAAAGAGLLGTNMASTAIDAERIRFALDRVTNGDGAKWWATSADYAQRFGLSVNAVADNLMKMKASGFSDDMASTLFLRMGDLRAVGAGEGEIDRALLAIRQIKSIGRLMGEELNQLTEAGVDASYVYEALGRKLGKTTPEVMKLKEAGKLTSDIVLPAIAEAIGTKTRSPIAGMAGEDAASKTLSGQWGRIKGAFSVATTNAITSDSLAPARDALGNFTTWLQGPGGQGAVSAFGGVITRIFEAAPAIINGIIWLLEIGLPNAWSSFTAAFESSGGSAAFSSLLGAARSLGQKDGAAMIVWMRDAATSAGNLAGSVSALVSAATPLISIAASLATIGMYVPNLLGRITGLFSGPGLQPAGGVANDNAGPNAGSMYTVGSDMAAGMAQGLYAGAPSVAGAASYLAQSAEAAARNESETHSPSAAWRRYAADNVAGYVQGIDDGIPSIESASGRVATAPAANVNAGGATGNVFNITNQVTIQETAGLGADEVADLVADRQERSLTRMFTQMSYAGGAG